MNTKKTSKRKSKTKPINTEPEVFVLPPNLLEKLGIKLDKIRPTEDSSTVVCDLEVRNCADHQENTDKNYYSNTEKTHDNESVSSILETANLMKESVFLSPTFVPTIANVITGEVEIASVRKELQDCKDNQIHEPANDRDFSEDLSLAQDLLSEPVSTVNSNESQVQGPVNIEHFPEPFSSTQKLVNYSVNTVNSIENQIPEPTNIDHFPERLSSVQELIDSVNKADNNDNQIQELESIEHFPEPLSSAQELLIDSINNADSNENEIQGVRNIENIPEPLRTAQEHFDKFVNVNSNENQIQKPAYTVYFPEILSSSQELVNDIKTVNSNENQIQGSGTIEYFSEPLSSAQDLPDESVNIIQNDNCCSQIKDNYNEYNLAKNDSDYIEIHFIQDGQESQDSLGIQSQNISFKRNKNDENSKKIINIINDEKIDFAKVNKLLTFDNNKILTPVPVGMLLPPTKAHINRFDSIEVKVPGNVINIQSQSRDKKIIHPNNCEDNCLYAHSAAESADVMQGFSKFNSHNTNWEGIVFNTNHNDLELCQNIPNSEDTADENMVNISMELENDTENNTNLFVNNLDSIQDHISESSLVFDISNENQQNSFEKKYENDRNEPCSSITKDNICNFEQKVHECQVETQLMSPNIILSDRNHTKNCPDNGMRKSKLCIQGVEKPGGQSKTKNSTLNVYCNRKKVNKPIHNNPENTAVMHSLPFYKKNKRSENFLLESKNIIGNIECEAHVNNEIVADTACKNAEYCLCSDFGQLKYYDEDSSFYEHIHFWQHKDNACKVDIIFSIYTDDILHTNKYDCDTTEENVLCDAPEESLHNICWTKMYHDQEEIHVLDKVNQNIVPEQLMTSNEKKNDKHVCEDPNRIDFEMSEMDNNNVIEKYNKGTKSEDWSNPSIKSTPVQMEEGINKIRNANEVRHATDAVGEDGNTVEDISTVRNVNKEKCINKEEDVNMTTGKKRKHSLRVSKEEEEIAMEYTNHLSKKDVKCGVCGQILARREWGEHSIKEHGFIAWKAGDVFDFEDKKLMLNIKQKFKEDGILKCAYCNKNKNSCEDYISHVKECIKNKNSCIKVDSSKGKGIANTLPVKKEAVITRTKKILKQESMNSDSPKKLKTEISLTSPVHNTSLKSGSYIPKDHNTPSAKEKVVNCGNLSKRVNAATSLTTLIKQKSGICSDSPIQDQINIKHTSTPLAQEKPKNRKVYTRKNKIDNGSPSTSREHDDQASKVGQRLDISTEADTSISNCKSTSTRSETVDTDISQEVIVKTEVIVETEGVLATSGKKKSKEFGSIKNPITDYDNKIISTPLAKKLTVKCGVCKIEMDQCHWNDHMQKAHNYIAWIEEEKPLDIDDDDQIWQHLHLISKKCNGLVCSKCGLIRKYVKPYLSHIKDCDGMDDSTLVGFSAKNDIDKSEIGTPLVKKRTTKCGDSFQGVNSETDMTPLFTESADSSMKVDNYRRTRLTSSALKATVKCGVCKKEMDDSVWIDHIKTDHNYLAWKDGESSIDLHDKDQIWQHLHSISKECDGLVCSKCGLNRKYVKAYLSHINQCDGVHNSTEADSSKIVDVDIITTVNPPACEDVEKSGDLHEESRQFPVKVDKGTNLTVLDVKVTVKCGVCKEEINDDLWNDHIQKEHNYLAWKEEESALDLQNEEQIRQHLYSISKKCDGLVCSKCGLNRKYVKAYLSHIKQCNGMNDTTEAESSKNEDSSQEANTSKTITPSFEKSNDCPMKVDKHRESTSTSLAEKVSVKCGVCKQDMDDNLWYDHIQKEHNYLAWKAEESSLDLNDKEQVWQHLHLIAKKCDGLICSKCGLNRKYVKPYLNHIKHCDGMNDSSEAVSSKNMDVDITTISNLSVTKKKYGEPSHKVHARSPRSSLTTTLSDVKATVKCGVCKQEMDDSLWCDHIQKEHNYLAWKDGENSIDFEDENQIWHHLQSISKKYDGLICSKCGLNGKTVRAYLGHTAHCDGTDNSVEADISDEDTKPNYTSTVEEKIRLGDPEKKIFVKCDVCKQEMDESLWVDHIQKEHNYLAWKEGETSVDLQDKEQVWQYLHSISKKYRGLVCWKCGLNRKYVKAYWGHIKQCDGMAPINSSSLLSSMDVSCISEVNMSQTENKDSLHVETCNNEKGTVITSESEVVKCGVCEQDVKGTNWIEHIRCNHNYIAWKHGEQPLDLKDTENVKLHFVKLSKQVDAFICVKCGDTKKYPKVFINHIETCDVNLSVSIDPSRLKNADSIECGVCAEQMKSNEWKSHAMKKHYNVAWRVGEYPIDLKSPNAVERFLKEYKQAVGTLVCKVCRISRVSVIGFYAHVLICGKSEKEVEEYNNHCEICDKTYVCVYKNQHMAAHREQELRKLRLEQNKEEETNVETSDTPQVDEFVGRRKAAVKARSVIEKLKINEDDQNNTCATCGFEANTASKLARHKCTVALFESGSDTDDSYVSGESDASVESDGSDSATDVSEEEETTTKKKRYKESSRTVKVPKMPCTYHKLNCYMEQNQEDFFQIHFTDEILFPEWLECKYEHLEDSQLNDYIPKVEQSCKIKLDHKWGTLNRFQVKKYSKGCSIFVGGSTQCLSWIPPQHDEENQSNTYLAISCHREADSPRYNFDELATHTGVIQIWNCGDFSKKLPKLVFCIAHDYGTVWAMDWCPSGARQVAVGDNTSPRLGLLAVACSNGSVYIFSVPHPSTTVESDNMFYKLKPVAELRISMSSKRRTYQATAICWSKQKGHAIVMVGYADGTTALYDLCSTSPLLKCVDNGVTVFYPYTDRRDHNVCITDVDVCPVADVGRGDDVGALCSASVGGTVTQLRSRAAQPRLHVRAPAHRVRFTPGWPAALLLPDDVTAYQSTNELDWYGCGRRVGPASAMAGCRRCGRVLKYSRPLLRYFDSLPPYSEIKKHTLAIIKTSPLSKKRKLENDELAMLVEPLTYDEAITQYGVEVTPVEHNHNVSISSMREPFTERFPLSEVTSMAFCPSRRHHRIAAVGLHAGFVLILTV